MIRKFSNVILEDKFTLQKGLIVSVATWSVFSNPYMTQPGRVVPASSCVTCHSDLIVLLIPTSHELIWPNIQKRLFYLSVFIFEMKSIKQHLCKFKDS